MTIKKSVFRQASWDEPLIFQMGEEGRTGFKLPRIDEEVKRLVGDPGKLVPSTMRRQKPPALPELSEVQVARHFVRLSQMSYGVDSGFYPLGSCTMKYNPKINDQIAGLEKLNEIHPYQDLSTVQGSLEIIFKLEKWLAEIMGMYRVSVQPAAGANGEFTGIQIIRAYHRLNHELGKRTDILVPDSAHGTNPSSAAMGGFNVVTIPSNEKGCMNIDALKAAISDKTAGLMLTNPNTLGLFEEDIGEIAELVHGAGGLLYYDGANLNAIVGRIRPGDMGFDIVHTNLHKTFSTPHGGGGPGAGPVGVTKQLERFLPIPTVEFDGEHYYFDYDRPQSIGKVKGFYGNFGVLVRAFTYILTMGAEGLAEAASIAVLNSNYIASKLSKLLVLKPTLREKPRKHESVLSGEKLKQETGVTTLDVAKRLLDHGIHAPTIYFPSIVEEALMVEPTESATKEDLDNFAEAMEEIVREAHESPRLLHDAPVNTSRRRLDERKAAHPKTLCLTWRMFNRKI
ncbi:MAG: aminomethyl-transferring glycine dehydrogenase subunit GcvPB [Promethearchaeati archaeon SRVP18_Atabeyarchaeia-1]